MIAGGNKFNIILGAAGEHYIMSRLLLMNVVACTAPQGAPGVDIVVADANGSSLLAIQVKARRANKDGSWTMGQKSETLVGDKLVYCFVRFSSDQEPPSVYIVPSKVVSDYARDSHANWVETPGRRGQAHQDNAMRKFDLMPTRFQRNGREYGPGWAAKYREAWSIIEDMVRSH